MNKVVEDLKNFGTVQRALLGITATDVSTKIDMEKENGKDVDYGTVTGIYVNEVTADGAAAEAGLQEGDVIIELDGKKIDKFGELQEALVAHRPGDHVKVTYLRNKSKRTATVTLRNIQGTTSAVQNLDTDELGVALRPLTEAEKKELSLSHGLMITAVRDGLMKKQGVAKGIILMQVNDVKLNTVQDFENAVKAANLSTERVLWIRAKTQSGLNRSYNIEFSEPKAKEEGKSQKK